MPAPKVVAFSNHNRPTKPRHSGPNQTAVKGTHKRGDAKGGKRGSTSPGRDLGKLGHLGCSQAGVQGGSHQAHHPAIRHHPRLSSSPGPCSSSNPFPPPALLQPSGEKAPPWLISAPTKGQHWGDEGGKMFRVGFVPVTRRVRLPVRGFSLSPTSPSVTTSPRSW